ncbi:peptide deformylase [Hydrogenimonas urashimensis]|uniref:peptide deformylase n=1 Tax=Hydrogenimonas urashimensis TaxID=2740515 RepID=UPI00191641AF|nr:peptide deformylase [Hydrogenimonas urashimensis]
MSVKKELIVYPDERIHIPCSDVRNFDDTLFEVIEMMKEVIEENDAEGLAAIQTGYPYNIVIVRLDNGSYLELINPRILRYEGKTTAKEKTLYYPDIEIEVPRYEKIKLIYEDRYGKQHHMEAEGKLARVIQRKIDYTFGGTFLTKVKKEIKEAVEKALAENGLVPEVELCPTFSKRVYFLSVADKLLFFMFLTLFAKLFNPSIETLATFYTFDKIGGLAVVFLMIGYFIYGRWEAKKYTSCTSCQVGNMIGSMAKRLIAAIVIGTATYFLVNPAM